MDFYTKKAAKSSDKICVLPPFPPGSKTEGKFFFAFSTIDLFYASYTLNLQRIDMEHRNACGIWIGADAAVAPVEAFRLSFPRFQAI